MFLGKYFCEQTFIKIMVIIYNLFLELCAPPSEFIPPNEVMYDGAEDIGQEDEEEPIQLPEEDLELVGIY